MRVGRLIEGDRGAPGLGAARSRVKVKTGCGRSYRARYQMPAERAFSPGQGSPVFHAGGLRFGVSICYDTTFPDTARAIAEAGADLILCCANNMMPRDRAVLYRDVHNAERARRCREAGLWMASSDVTGERDGMVSWGPGAIISPVGDVVAQLALERPGLLIYDIPVTTPPASNRLKAS